MGVVTTKPSTIPSSNTSILHYQSSNVTHNPSLASNSKLKDKALQGGFPAVLSTSQANCHLPSDNTSLTVNRNATNSAAEVEKWKKFGYLMAESYDELKKENEKLKQEKEKDRKIVIALKDQVDKLKKIIQAKSIDENIETLEREKEFTELKEREVKEIREKARDKDRVIEDLNQKLSEA
jgi:hypothetical protein